MPNSHRHRLTTTEHPPEEYVWTTFASDLGWIGIAGHDDCVAALTFGHTSPVQVHHHLAQKIDLPDTAREFDWFPELREQLTDYAVGNVYDFSKVKTSTEGFTPFRISIVEALKEIPHGKTVSYAELATLAGRPRAARAVGTAMATNQIPLIIPCHRVVAAGGNLGGFSAPNGLSMKQRLLQLEQVTHIKFDENLTAVDMGQT